MAEVCTDEHFTHSHEGPEMSSAHNQRPSLESLVENENLGFEVLHPGGLEITRDLAVLCKIQKDRTVLDVASGTGESACFLQKSFGCQVTGIDASAHMIERAKNKAAARNLRIAFQQADAHYIPFEKNTFDAVIAECTICLLEKEKALREMARVVKPGGYVGIHDICWQEGAPERMKQRLAEIEGEKPDTLDGWKGLFQKVGLGDVQTQDKSYLMPIWTKTIKKELGIKGQIKIFLKVIQNWGFKGLRLMLESAEIFQSKQTGYGIIVGRKPDVSAP